MTTQPNLPTMKGIPPNGNLRQRIAWILDHHPEAKEDYRLTAFYYWLEYDGLAGILAPGAPQPDIDAALSRFLEWYITTARNPKTLLQRTQEVQRERPHLAPSAQTQARRKRQGRAGPINN